MFYVCVGSSGGNVFWCSCNILILLLPRKRGLDIKCVLRPVGFQMTTLSFLSNNALLKTTIEAVFQENDVSTVTPRIIFTALAARFDCPLESITEDAAAKSRIKELARDIVRYFSMCFDYQHPQLLNVDN